MQTKLLVLAARMDSRYGSPEQMDGVGTNNETIMDYSIFDAIRASFGKVVFVKRHTFEDDFKAIFNKVRFRGKIEVEYVFQDLDNITACFKVPKERVKPWGTNHAVMMADGVIDTPFTVINADDFYGKEAYQIMASYLKGLEGQDNKYCMVG